MIYGYNSGFAPRDYAPLYPGLWCGRVLSVCPSLGNTGTTLQDWSGRKSHGTLNSFTLNSQYAINQGGYALTANGSQFVSHVHQSWYAFERTDSFSYACWVRSTNSAGTNTFVSKWNSATSAGTYFINEPTTGYLRMFIQGTSNYIEVKGAINVFDGAWNHVAMTYNGTSLAAGVKLYVNGKPDTVTVVVDTLATSIANTTALQWFSRQNGSLRLTGSMDDMCVYNRVLNPEEVRLLASSRGVAYIPLRRQLFVPSAAASQAYVIGGGVGGYVIGA